jgi:hypothetical protein
MNINLEHWWNDTDRRKPKYWVRNLSQCHIVHHISYVVCPATKSWPIFGAADDEKLEPRHGR